MLAISIIVMLMACTPEPPEPEPTPTMKPTPTRMLMPTLPSIIGHERTPTRPIPTATRVRPTLRPTFTPTPDPRSSEENFLSHMRQAEALYSAYMRAGKGHLAACGVFWNAVVPHGTLRGKDRNSPEVLTLFTSYQRKGCDRYF